MQTKWVTYLKLCYCNNIIAAAENAMEMSYLQIEAEKLLTPIVTLVMTFTYSTTLTCNYYTGGLYSFSVSEQADGGSPYSCTIWSFYKKV